MNKFEKALDRIKKRVEPSDDWTEDDIEHYKTVWEALEKQMPKKPVGRHTSYKCPVCDRRVRSGKGSSSFGVDHFCQRCGQALLWEE
ncbi:MAG: hypothetical protein IJX57_03590 [Clostridia bacterium]|nr:hypothetical protein [Clostridia bacterium]